MNTHAHTRIDIRIPRQLLLYPGLRMEGGRSGGGGKGGGGVHAPWSHTTGAKVIGDIRATYCNELDDLS